MKIEKLIELSDIEMPVMAALPILVSGEEKEFLPEGNYNPELQLTVDIKNSYSTCKMHDSIVRILDSKADHGKDD